MEELKTQSVNAVKELIKAAKLKKGDILVIGCSTSEILGEKIGTNSAEEVATEVFNAIYSVTEAEGIRLAAQCCEHLNRAIVCDGDKFPYAEKVNVVPQKKAGGSFATAAYKAFKNPVVVEKIRADAGMDIGDTLIGMHLKEVAVPVRLSVKKIGQANLVCARTRPKFIGGIRAVYDENLL